MSDNSQQKLDQMVKKGSCELAPDRELWTGIEQALNQANKHENMDVGNERDKTKKVAWQKPSFAIAASVFVALTVGFFAYETGKSVQGDALIAAMSEQHQNQKQSLLIRFKDRPAATNNWQQQLKELDEAASAIKKALEEEPNNPALLKMLKNVYEQQMAIIERVHKPTWNQA
jgi:hypothetical protein